MLRPYIHNGWRAAYAYFASERAAGRKPAALGDRSHIGKRSLDRRKRFHSAIETGNGGEEPDRIRMLRGIEQCVDRRMFDNLARIHHGNLVADLRNHSEI